MSTENIDMAQPPPKEKFFFHMNVFDDEDVIEEEEIIEEDLPPPPPMYSQDELQAAKDAAYAQGRSEAEAEAQASRSKFVAEQLRIIAEKTAEIFATEAVREKRYEQEALALSIAVFEKLFPVYADAHGFDELQAQLAAVLLEHHGQSAIQVTVHTDMVEAITTFMGKLQEKNSELSFVVKGDDGVSASAAHLSWKDGGAVRDTHAMAAQALQRMQELLAAPPATSHDKEEINKDNSDE